MMQRTTDRERIDGEELESREHTARETTDASAPGNGNGSTMPTGTPSATEREQLFGEQETQGYRSRWETIQSQFVDNPRQSVEQANQLVSEVNERLTSLFSDERGRLEEQWSRNGEASTDDLRNALRRYRSFFDRLLAA